MSCKSSNKKSEVSRKKKKNFLFGLIFFSPRHIKWHLYPLLNKMNTEISWSRQCLNQCVDLLLVHAVREQIV